MATIFPREEKAEMLFDKILANPEACRRLKRTFYDAIDSGDEFVTENLPAKQFTAALFDAYENKDLTAFLMAVCQNSMFDLLRNAFLIPFKFNADGQTNPVSVYSFVFHISGGYPRCECASDKNGTAVWTQSGNLQRIV